MSAKIRVYDLARELGMTNKELLDVLTEEGIEVKSHASCLDDDIAELIREHVISERETREEELDSANPAEDVQDDSDDDNDSDSNEIHLKPPVIVRDLAEAIDLKPNQLIGELMMMNIFAAINQVLENDIVEKVCEKHGFKFVKEKRSKPKKHAEETKKSAPKAKKSKKKKAATRTKLSDEEATRPPVVAFLGHVDHGKTSLQDYIRETHVTKGEAGGITQHIGASMAEWNGHKVTFLDTPGHEAFTAMRARGANATDIAVLVVAADDGVMPQTKEAINHVLAAEVPIIVAMNKIDLPSANPDKIMLELQQNGLTPEEWGGEIGVVPCSAITGEGIEDLLERILLEAEMVELTGNEAAQCEAIVIEAQLESGMGPTANVLIRNGSLHVGDAILCGPHSGRAKALIDARGERIKVAGPSCPVKVLGLSGVPEAGSILTTCESEKEAKSIAADRHQEARDEELAVKRASSIEDLFAQIESGNREEIKVILKTDVRGSSEAIRDSLMKIESEKIKLNIISCEVGEISENDVLLAAASDALLVGFHVRVMPKVTRLAKSRGVDIRLYSIIYELLEQIEGIMLGRLEPEFKETQIGAAEIKQVINTSKFGRICGCYVSEGSVRVSANAKVYREDELIYNGQVASLRRFKDDVKEVKAGLECGIRLDNFEEFEENDKIIVSSVEKVAAKL